MQGFIIFGIKSAANLVFGYQPLLVVSVTSFLTFLVAWNTISTTLSHCAIVENMIIMYPKFLLNELWKLFLFDYSIVEEISEHEKTSK